MSEPADTPNLADALDAQATASRAVALSLDFYDEAIRELRATVLELREQQRQLEANVANLERIARNEGLHRRAQ